MTDRSTKNSRTSQIALLVSFVLVVAARGVTVYETTSPNGLQGGISDEYIFADDVHFRNGGIITNVMISLRIKNTQLCRLWIFDRLGHTPIHVISFPNIPTTSGFRQYSFPMRLDVPKDIYIGFSAEGDGSGEDREDYAELCSVVSSGIASTSGIFYRGPTIGGLLDHTAVFPEFAGYFKIRVEMLQPKITDLVVTNNESMLWVTNISENATYLVERSFNLLSNQWETAGEFTPNSALASWSETISNDWQNASYRIRTID